MHREFAPPHELEKIIKCFWYEKRESTAEPLQIEVQPDSYTEIVFYFGGTCGVHQNGLFTPLPSPFIVGLLNHPVTFYCEESFEAICIRCYPWMLFDLLKLPPDQIPVQSLNHPVARLQPILDKLVINGNIEGAVNEIEKFFLHNPHLIVVNNMLYKAGTAITAGKGTMPVSKVATAAYATVRTLERNFKQSSGHTVKDVSALMRFEQVRNCLWNQPDISLAALAHEAGYTDQAHLSKEFKRFAGITPAAFARNRTKAQRDERD